MLKKVKVKNNDEFSSYDLEEFFRQTPNRKFFLLPYRPYLHAYYYGEKIFDSTKVENRFNQKIAKVEQKIEAAEDSAKQARLTIKKADLEDKKQEVLKEGNWLMRSVGEKIVVYDSVKIENTRVQLGKYMHSEGFFRSSVTTQLKKKRKSISVTFEIEENDPYIIAYTYLVCPQKELKSILIRHTPESILKKGARYSDDVLSRERERITNLLKSEGYFLFSRNYVYFEVDSTLSNGGVHIRTVISTPENGHHDIYTLREIYTTTDINKQKTIPRDSVWTHGIHYLWYKRTVSEKILTKKIKIGPRQKYSYENTVQTQKNLANMNMYKFVNINYYEVEDSTGNHEVDAYISMSPFQKFQFSSEFGVNVFQGLPGPFSNATFRTRNLFHGAEVLDVSVRAGIEGQSSIISPSTVLTTQEFGANIGLTFPQFLLPRSMLKKANDYNPQSRLQTGISLVNRAEFTRDNFTTSFSYQWQKGKNTRSVLTPFELTVINTKNQSTTFQEYLAKLKADNNPLYLSFRQSIISSIRYDFIFDNNLNKRKRRSKYFRLSLESGGTTLNFFQNEILSGQAKLFGLDYYQYMRAFTDFRYYIPTKNKNIVATRMSFGVGKPVGGTNVLPYEKYFFSGGSYSNRAWLPRRLGPGAYTPVKTNSDEFDTDYRIEQPGELLFESNIEYRFRIKGVLDGAIFTDVSNVWMINEDSREGAQFLLNSFYEQLAVGSGFGFRFDFSFLILRLDIGAKIWDPALPLADRFTPADNSIPKLFTDSRLSVLNLGIGYPF